MRPSKLRLPDNTAATASWLSVIAAVMSLRKGPELPMHVMQPYPTTLKPSASRGCCKPLRDRYSDTTSEPGENDVFTHGLLLSPLVTALRAISPAASITDGFDVFVQLVIAASTMSPWPSE